MSQSVSQSVTIIRTRDASASKNHENKNLPSTAASKKDSSTAHTQEVLAVLEVQVNLSNSMIHFLDTHLNIVAIQI